LAWCARVDRESDAVSVLHGSGVETQPQGFVEGAWNDSFASLNFTDATVVCGTGGILEHDRVRFSASTDQSGPLFSVAKAGSVYVSNSPAFVMAVAGELPDDIYPFYPYDLLRIYQQGLYCPHGLLRLQSSASLGVHFYTMISVDPRGSVTFDTHRLCEAPQDYESYKKLLLEGVSKVIENAADPTRRRRYRPLVSLSKGYDSTATAVLARSAGCTEALTFIDTRQEDPNLDSGADNAQYLGMTCKVYGRWQYLHLDRCAEAEFGYVSIASTAPLAVAEDQLAGRVLLGGEAGDAVWHPERAKACVEMTRPWIRHTMMLSAIEFRLRVGYYILSPACIAARHNGAIHDIATSAEMQPWSVGGDYDRPIPRRIAEEAGLARNRFGTRKLASAHSHLIYPRRFSEKALNDYRRFVNQRHAQIPRDIYRHWRTQVQQRHQLWDAMDNQHRNSSPTSLPPHFATPLRAPWDFMFTFQWTVASMRSRYTQTAQGALDPDPLENPDRRGLPGLRVR